MEGLRSKQPQGVSELCERTDEDAERIVSPGTANLGRHEVAARGPP
jgi:hypothetical protein